MTQQLNTIKHTISIMNQASKKYETQKKILGPEVIHNLEQFSKTFEADALSIIESNRKLKIGVVGQIKAGKSSFLNALLFNGKDLLPKAATPMTAALTIISFAKKPKAEIEYYTKDEWLLIVEKAKQYETLLEQKRHELSQGRNKFANKLRQASPGSERNQKTISVEELRALVQAPDDIKTAHELYLLANESTLPIQELLGTVQTIEHTNETDELIGELQQYVGAEGLYTPIVKSTKVFIPNEVLKTVEVVDTPGINDPIISRGQKTRDYLGKCDVVFLLSYSGQFMDSVDVELLTQNIPDKGIVNVVLLGSKFDSVLQDIGGHSLSQSIALVNRKLNEQAQKAILPILNKFPENKVLQSLKESLPPIFISSMAYNIANHHPNLNKEQQHIYSRLQSTYTNDQLTPALLKDLSNIDRIKNIEIAKVLENKEKILNERFDHLLNAQIKTFIKELSAIRGELEKDLSRLVNSNEEDLENHFKNIDKGINQARKNVDLVFSRNILEMEKGFGRMKSDFKESAIRSRKFNEINETRREIVGTERYGFLWLKKRNIYETRTYTSANVHQTIDNIENLVLELDKKVKADFNTIIQMEKLTIELKNAVKGIFDLSDESFDFNDVIVPVEKTVNKISIPKFEISSDKYRDKITKAFGLGKVEGSEVNKLREMQYKQIDEILKDVEREINQTVANIQVVFNKVSSEFIDDVLRESQQKKEKLQDELKNLKETKAQYGQLLEELEYDISELKNNGNNPFRLVNGWNIPVESAKNKVQKESQQAQQEVVATEVSEKNSKIKNLIQGQRVFLPSIGKFVAKMSGQLDSIELDLSAFLVQKNGKVSGDEDFIFYNQDHHTSNAIRFINGSEQSLEISLNEIPRHLSKVIVTCTISPEQVMTQNFSMVKDLCLHLYDEFGKEQFRYPVTTNFTKETGIVLSEIYRYQKDWKLGTIGKGFYNGLKGLCDLFGVQAE